VDAAEFLQYRASEGEIVDRILMNLHPNILAQAAFLPRPGSYRELRDMVGLIEERMAVLAERQPSDKCSSSSQMTEKRNLSDNKPSGVAVEGKQSSKNGPTCWRCGKQGHVQRTFKGHNFSGAVAAIAPNGDPPVRVLGQEDVEARAHLEKERHPTDSEIRSETINSVKARRRPRFSRKRHCQRGRINQLKGGAGPPINPPLWVKLNFKLEEVPALVDTGAQFSCIRRDVVSILLI